MRFNFVNFVTAKIMECYRRRDIIGTFAITGQDSGNIIYAVNQMLRSCNNTVSINNGVSPEFNPQVREFFTKFKSSDI
jgi:hypothetical protein